MSSVQKYLQLSSSDRKLVREALRTMYGVAILLRFLPFHRIEKRFAKTHQVKTASKTELIQIRQAIRRANQLAIWKNTCLTETLTARKMLNRRGISSRAFLGMHNENGVTVPHAAIFVGKIAIVPKMKEQIDLHEF